MVGQAKLYVGGEPKNGDAPLLLNEGFIPITWLTLISTSDAVNRQSEFPEQWIKNNDSWDTGSGEQASLDDLLDFMQATIGYRTTVTNAIINVKRFINQMKVHPYFWAYFKCLDVFLSMFQYMGPDDPIVFYFDELLDERIIDAKDIAEAIKLVNQVADDVAQGKGDLDDVLETFKEVYRLLGIPRRVIPRGSLTKDFMKIRAKDIVKAYLGEFNPKSGRNLKEFGTFDLRYWVKDSLTVKDLPLHFELSISPTEKAEKEVKRNRLHVFLDDILSEFLSYASEHDLRITSETLNENPEKSRLFAIRVLIKGDAKTMRPATILAPTDGSTWFDRLEENINEPSVREDFNYVETLYLGSLEEREGYKIIFGGAKNIRDVKRSYVRWLRKHRWAYLQKYGIDAMIDLLGDYMVQIDDPVEGKRILEALTEIANLGFPHATEVLSRDDVIAKLPEFLS